MIGKLDGQYLLVSNKTGILYFIQKQRIYSHFSKTGIIKTNDIKNNWNDNGNENRKHWRAATQLQQRIATNNIQVNRGLFSWNCYSPKVLFNIKRLTANLHKAYATYFPYLLLTEGFNIMVQKMCLHISRSLIVMKHENIYHEI